jgi:hypothetical protein
VTLHVASAAVPALADCLDLVLLVVPALAVLALSILVVGSPRRTRGGWQLRAMAIVLGVLVGDGLGLAGTALRQHGDRRRPHAPVPPVAPGR